MDRLVPHGVGNRFGIGPDGRMRHRKGKVLKQTAIRTDHLRVTLSRLGKHPAVSVHVVIKETFDGPTPEGMMVCHDNGNPVDNKLSNLYFGTAYENSMDTHRHGTNHQLNKDHCPRGHLYEGPNILHKTNNTRNGIRPSRECRACDNTRCRRAFLRRKGADEGFDFKAVSDAYYAKIMSRGRLAKFTSEDVLCISKRLAAGEPIKALAEEYGVSKGPIYDIKNDKHPLQKRVPFIPEQRKPLDTEIHAETDGQCRSR